MKTSVISILTLAALAGPASLPFHAAAAENAGSNPAAVKNADGTQNWIWTNARAGSTNAPRETVLSFKIDGSSLTGKLSTPGSDGKPVSTPITGGKADGDSISFVVIREVNGNAVTNQYSGKISGDTLTGTIAFTRNGEPATRKWEAKNAGAKSEAASVAPPKPGYDENGNKIVNETHYKELNIADTEKLLAEHPETEILDLRPPAQYAAGHIPGAKNVDLSDKETYLNNLKPLDKNKRYLVYSVVGHFRTVRALEYFEANGVPHAAAIDGGFKAWSTANKPVEK